MVFTLLTKTEMQEMTAIIILMIFPKAYVCFVILMPKNTDILTRI